MTRVALVLVATAIAATAARAADPTQTLYRTNRDGNRAYQRNELDLAQKKYEEAQQMAPHDPRIAYNQGTVATARGQAEDANTAYERALQNAEGSLRRDTWYNRGVNALQQKQWPQAIKSFGEALKLDASDAEARRNLELAVRQLQQQQQQRQPKPQQGGKPQPEQGQKPQPQPQPGSGDKQPQPEQSQQQQPGAGQQQQQQEPSPPTGDSNRLLDQLRSDEAKALRKALKRDNRKPNQRGGGDVSREKDW